VSGGDAVFSKLAQAYQVLSDPVARALYDIAQGYKKDSPEERRRINAMKRTQAVKLAETSEATVAQIREEEQSVDGLLLVEALYGDISVDAYKESADKVGRCIDVTIPLQLCVRNSMLFKHASDSHAYLDGFYDPNDNEMDNMLYIRYQFNGDLHEVVFKDDEDICLPLQEHLISPEDVEHSDTAETDVEDGVERRRTKTKRSKLRNVNIKPRAQALREMQAIKAARRRRLYTVLGSSLVASLVYTLQKWNIIDIRRWAPVKMVMDLIYNPLQLTSEQN
jgi:curved DNA-binding protein CbpA